MPINIISHDDESLLGEYVDRKGVSHPIDEILGDFSDDTIEEKKLTLLNEASRMGLINGSQHMAIKGHIMNPQTSEEMRRRGKNGAKSRWKK